MKKTFTMALLAGILLILPAGVGAQEEEKAGQPPPTLQTERPRYNAEGRRDPFKDLLRGAEAADRTSSTQGPQLSIEDLNLIGIVKFRGEYRAIVNGPQGFPYTLKKGDMFSDGFVFSITDTAVIFRQTSERGIRLPNPRDIVKEITPEER